jgi:hypothetical protein
MCMLDNRICLRISCQRHSSLDYVIIDTHIMDILSNELTTMVKGYKIRSWIMCEPFLLNNVSNSDWFLIAVLFNLQPAGCQIDHSDAFQRRNLNSFYIAFDSLILLGEINQYRGHCLNDDADVNQTSLS